MSDYKSKLLIHQEFIAKHIELDDILAVLYKDRAISREESDRLKTAVHHEGMNTAAEKLMQLLSTKDVTAFDKFVTSLKVTGQESLANKLEISDDITPETKLSTRDIETLTANKSELVNGMEIKGVLKHLERKKEFWTRSEKQHIKSKLTPKKQAEALIDHVATGTHLQLTHLIEALQHVDQYDLIRKLPVGLNVSDNSASKKEPDAVLTQITVNSAQTHLISEISRQDICKLLVKYLNDITHDVRKKVSKEYNLKSLEAKLIPEQPVKFNVNFFPKSVSGASKLHTDVENERLALVIIQYSHLSDTRPFELIIEIIDEQNTDNGYEATATATTSTGRIHSRSLAVVRKAVHEMIDKKEYTPYDLWAFLQKHRGQSYNSPFELSDEDGIPLTHMCVERGRFPLLLVIFHMGWWTLLSRRKVPAASSSLYKGMTCLELAEAKRSRKPVEEVKMYTEWEESLSSIMKSARSGDYARVVTLIGNEGESIHYRDMNNGNALYWAVVSGSLKIFQALLRKGGVDPTMRTRKNETLLHIACVLGKAEFISELLSCNIDVNFQDNNRKSALDRVAENGDIESLKAFVSCGIQLQTSFLVLAAFSGRRALLKYCLNNKYSSINSQDQYDRTPLMRAVEGCKADIVTYLLGQGALLDLMPTTNRNLLHTAAEAGSTDIFNILISALNEKSLLEKFINQRDRYNGVELCFLIRGRDNGRDAWHYVEVVRHRSILFTKKTKSGNVDVSAFGTVIKSGWGMNPEQETIDAIEQLFKSRRLDRNAPADCTPLHVAIFKDNTDIAKLLLQNGADVNVKDKFGLTPLMLASSRGNLEIMQELEKYGAKFNDVNNDGQTATEIANENENDNVIHYINGRDSHAVCQNFIRSDVERVKTAISKKSLDELRQQGKDVKKHIIDTLRDFRIDINQMLLDLGSGPILEASEDIPPSNTQLSSHHNRQFPD